jgi:hypothetical protein
MLSEEDVVVLVALERRVEVHEVYGLVLDVPSQDVEVVAVVEDVVAGRISTLGHRFSTDLIRLAPRGAPMPPLATKYLIGTRSRQPEWRRSPCASRPPGGDGEAVPSRNSPSAIRQGQNRGRVRAVLETVASKGRRAPGVRLSLLAPNGNPVLVPRSTTLASRASTSGTPTEASRSR